MTNLLSALPPSYPGFAPSPVIPFAPNANADRQQQWDWTNTAPAIPSGLTIASTHPTNGVETWTLAYVGLTRSDARTLEQFVEDRRGRLQGFWCPTFQHDFYVVAPSLLGGAVAVRDWGFAPELDRVVLDSIEDPFYWARHFFAAYGGRWMLSAFNGAVYGAGSFDAAGVPIIRYPFGDAIGEDLLSPGYTSAGGLMMGRLRFVRFADDAMTTEWTHPNFASITLRVVTDVFGGTP